MSVVSNISYQYSFIFVKVRKLSVIPQKNFGYKYGGINTVSYQRAGCGFGLCKQVLCGAEPEHLCTKCRLLRWHF